MARVPTYTQPTVEARPIGAPQLGYQQISAPSLAFDTGGSGMAQAGQQIARTADTAMSFALKRAEDDAQAVANEALTAFKRSSQDMLFNRDDAFFRQSGRAAYDASSRVEPMLEQERQRLGADLPERARKYYDLHSAQALTSTMEPVLRHGIAEGEKWRDASTEATISTNLNEAGLFWNDQARRDSALTEARNAWLGRAVQRGWQYDDPQNMAGLAKIDSRWASTVIQKMAETAPMAAKAFFDEHKGKLLPEHFSAVASHVEQKSKLYQVDQEVARVKALSMAGAVASGDLDAITAAIHAQESGGRATSATSIDGARGGMQILPATFTRYARPGESIDNPADNMAVGKRIIADLAAKTGGDPARIAVGYFSGEGNIAPPGSPTPWKEDRADSNGKSVSSYVKEVLGKVGGQSSRATDFELRRNAILNNNALTPEVRQAVLTRLEHDHAQESAILEQKGKEARRSIQEMVLTKKIDPMAVPADLQTLVGPEFMGHMQAAYGRGGVVPFNPQVENQLHELALKDPEKFTQTDLSPLYATHKTERVEYWQAQQRQMASAEGRAVLRQPSYTFADKVVGELFPYGEKDKKRAESSPDDATNNFVRNVRAKEVVRSWVDAWHDENKKSPTSDDVYRFVRSIGLQEDAWFSSGRRIDAIRAGTSSNFTLKINKDTLPDISQASGIPAAVVPQVSDYLKARNMPVTLENLIMAHRAGTSGKGRPTAPAAAPPAAAPPPFSAGGGPSLSYRLSAAP